MRERNGWVDEPLRNPRKKCPSCGSANYTETLSREKCSACGLECDYWGGGTNAVYESYLANHHAEQERLEEERFRQKYGDDDEY